MASVKLPQNLTEARAVGPADQNGSPSDAERTPVVIADVTLDDGPKRDTQRGSYQPASYKLANGNVRHDR